MVEAAAGRESTHTYFSDLGCGLSDEASSFRRHEATDAGVLSADTSIRSTAEPAFSDRSYAVISQLEARWKGYEFPFVENPDRTWDNAVGMLKASLEDGFHLRRRDVNSLFRNQQQASFMQNRLSIVHLCCVQSGAPSKSSRVEAAEWRGDMGGRDEGGTELAGLQTAPTVTGKTVAVTQPIEAPPTPTPPATFQAVGAAAAASPIQRTLISTPVGGSSCMTPPTPAQPFLSAAVLQAAARFAGAAEAATPLVRMLPGPGAVGAGWQTATTFNQRHQPATHGTDMFGRSYPSLQFRGNDAIATARGPSGSGFGVGEVMPEIFARARRTGEDLRARRADDCN